MSTCSCAAFGDAWVAKVWNGTGWTTAATFNQHLNTQRAGVFVGNNSFHPGFDAKVDYVRFW